jgi:cell wall-associated NlpC family hydrolase/LysM repeat protein
MNNRKLSPPMLSVLVLSLAVALPLVSKAQVTDSNHPAPASPPPTAAGTVTAPPATHTTSYTVVEGDSLTSIARKFNTTRKKLRTLNDLAVSKVTSGQVLLVPALPVAKARVHHTYLVAQPVQDFDVPASTFASCPVPLPTPGDDAGVPATAIGSDDVGEKPAPIAKLVSPADLAAEPPEVEIITPATPPPAPVTPVARAEIQSPAMPASGGSTKSYSTFSARPSPAATTAATTSDVRPVPLPLSDSDWGARFFQRARALGNEGIEYNEDWRPPGESRSWTMDCSNTARYLYKVTAGIDLPRTASDQYYYLHLQDKAWDVPLNSNGFVDTDYLRRRLKPGDLLFWENTYRPERQPPITHVMVYLGANEKGQWIMAGSQSSRGGEHNRRNGGPDIYVFRPSQACGGYTTWLGLVHHKGRFCAFGRPLEADPSKLSVADSE